ncbi:hypothetical protein M0G43_01255 [Subsaxibacter sp. CAU 1640]|uniref:hypothetical protein n=1 Tax=Subsaxibacter sp. CAU 1640 TaxID=2933271 RepID=UPI00200409DF|nr:hypothetical protein [Subsaxibacter sp. CAU 1640]MCK7589191.1 hypothetical protein [Subsaxibacter sp. CAU 1640]
MKNILKIVPVLFLGMWTTNHAASELNSVTENIDAYTVSDCSFEENLLAIDLIYFVDIRLQGSLTINGCVMTYDITVSYSILKNEVTNVSGSLSFSGACSGSVNFDIEMRSNSDHTINELPVFDDVHVNNKKEFEQLLVREINQAIIRNN